ncbi:MAG: sulfatase-like hydrolase/transferase [Planctomycetota bacterium]|nr:sulfatase-like hydrolase/transferase [Planctomycetota bacterium]
MRFFCALQILTVGLLLTQSTLADSPAPNVIIFLADDMGAGDTSAYQDWAGNSNQQQLHTPAMEELARRGIRFTSAHAPHSRCTTTRYALLTGRYCWRTSVKHWVLFGNHGDPLIDPQRMTLPEFLQDAGYLTGMVGKWHLGLTYRRTDGSPAKGFDDADLRQPLANTPIDHGFDFFYGISRSHGTSGPGGLKRINTPQQSTGPGWIQGREVVGATDEGKKLVAGSYNYGEVGNVMDRQAHAFLARAVTQDKPFFLYFASPANHGPYTPSKEISGIPVAGASRYKDGTPTENNRQDFVYQNDVHISRLLQYLKRTPDPRRPDHRLIDNTLFVFASDNGAEKNNKQFTGPVRSNKGSTYEGGHRIPFIASWPAGSVGDGDDTTPGKTQSTLLGLNDLYATLAEILAKPLPPVTGIGRGAEDSISQLSALKGNTAFRRTAALFPNDHQEASKKLSDERAWVAVRSNTTPLAGQWKLFLDHRYAFQQEVHPQELYNLAVDPMEQQNLLEDPEARPALDYLIAQATQAAGDDGFTRTVKPDQVFLLPYFLGNGESGIYFSYSHDGLNFRWLNDGKVVMPAPPWKDENLTRDPSIIFREGRFHMIWTTSWNSRSIGYCHSKDLVHWSQPQKIDIWGDRKDIRNTWAPELHWDPEKKEYLIIWSSTTLGELNDGDGSEDKHGYDHRTYASRTRDFKSFSKPELFFTPTDPEYSVIDPYLAHDDRNTPTQADDRWVMVIKHELSEQRGGKNLRLTFSRKMQGPYASKLGPPIVGAGTDIVDRMGEGPSLFKRDGLWYLYWDAPGSTHSYCLATSRDLKTWENQSQHMSLPASQMRHGTVLLVPRTAVADLNP